MSKLDAGRELDKLVALKVFRRRWDSREFGESGVIKDIVFFADGGSSREEIPFYSTKQSDAMKVVDFMAKVGGALYERFLDSCDSYVAQPLPRGEDTIFTWMVPPPKEVCISALKALDVLDAVGKINKATAGSLVVERVTFHWEWDKHTKSIDVFPDGGGAADIVYTDLANAPEAAKAAALRWIKAKNADRS